MGADKIYFPLDVWGGIGKLDESQIVQVDFESGNSIKAWVYNTVSVAFMTLRFSMNVVHKDEAGKEIDIPIPPDFSSTISNQFRSRFKAYVTVWTPDGALNGEACVLTMRGKGNTQAMNGILKRVQNAIIKPVQTQYPDHGFTLSHFKIPLKASSKGTRIVSKKTKESRMVYLPELNLTSPVPTDYLMTTEEMQACVYEWNKSLEWDSEQDKYNAITLAQYAHQIGYQPPEKVVHAALPPNNVELLEGNVVNDNTTTLPPQNEVPTSSYEQDM